MSFANKFGDFKAQVEDPADQPAPVAQKKTEKVMGNMREKKVVVKAKAPQDKSKVEEGGFTTDAMVQGARGPPRSDRGNRGNGRGARPSTARGGRGRGGEGMDERPKTDGASRGRGGNRGGERGGRGRGGDRRPREDGDRRPREDRTTQAVEGGEAPEHHNRGEKQVHGYQGKAREDYHPMDRKSGTGAGRKDMRKGGNRPGQTGENKKDNTPVVEGEEAKTEEKPVVEGEEKKEEEVVPVVEKVEEEEEEDLEALPGNYYADYEVERQKQKETGILAVKQVREHVEGPKDRIIADKTDKDMIIAGKTTFSGREMFAPKRGAGTEFLGFGCLEEEEFQPSAGRGAARGRGDRHTNTRGGAGRAADRGPRQQQPPRQGARKGGRIVGNEDDFPSL